MEVTKTIRKIKRTKKEKFSLFLKLIGYTIFLFFGIYILSKDYHTKNPLDLSAVKADELKDGICVEGELYKVMQHIGTYEGKEYYTVMLPSTDMTDWESFYDSIILEQKLPVTDNLR